MNDSLPPNGTYTTRHLFYKLLLTLSQLTVLKYPGKTN